MVPRGQVGVGGGGECVKQVTGIKEHTYRDETE